MKLQKLLPIVLFAGVTLFSNCKKDAIVTNSEPGNFPAAISKIVSTALLDTLKKAGMTIYPGSNPPIVNGNYAMKSDSTIFAGGMKIISRPRKCKLWIMLARRFSPGGVNMITLPQSKVMVPNESNASW